MTAATLDFAPAPAAVRAVSAPKPAGYFSRALVQGIILWSFPLLTVPMAFVVLFYPNNLLLWGYLWLFGYTHSVMTFSVYCQSGNLKHFARGNRNRLVYFGIPLLLFLLFDLYTAFKVGMAFPLVHIGFMTLFRMADFYHVGRQSFGVLQLFKTDAGVPIPKWVRRAENCHFILLALLILVTFFEGVRANTLVFPLVKSPVPDGDPLSAVLWAVAYALLAADLSLFCAVVYGYRAAARSSGKSLAKPFAYFLLQTVGMFLAVVYLPLYLVTGAVHYVEYQVLMYPRCFHTRLDEASRLDRTFGRVRQNPLFFYAVVLLLAGFLTVLVRRGMGTFIPGIDEFDRPMSFLMIAALLDGVFVFHFFIESFIWRFSDPHFRKAMSGLYFPAAPKAAAP